MSIANKVKPKIQKAINKFPTELDFKRASLNEFGEEGEETSICITTGLYYQGNNVISSVLMDKGQVVRSKQEFLIVLYDAETSKIKRGDMVTIKDKLYKVTDIINKNNLDIYYSILLECIE